MTFFNQDWCGLAWTAWFCYPLVATNPLAREWLISQLLLGLAPNTLVAYARGLDDFLVFCRLSQIEPLSAKRSDLARYVNDLRERPHPHRPGASTNLTPPIGLPNATPQQHLITVRLFFDFLIEEEKQTDHPGGRGRYTTENAYGADRERALAPPFVTMPWPPIDEQWRAFLQVVKQAPLRTRCIAAFASDAGLRREELCSLQKSDLDPAHHLVREAIAAWEAVRPAQPGLVDPKTREQVPFLFCYRAKRLSKTYLNHTLISTLCEWAGIPRADARGSISSHRARSTIASQLFNTREPMMLFELQTWLGHQSPATTQHYVSTRPTELAQAYKDAGYFARNVPAIEVLIGQEAITSGAAASGSPWRYYDLGHGWCSYEFFDQCPHRMAYARCDFYVPKESDRGLWLQTRDGLLKRLQEIPLSDEERAAVDGNVQALSRLLERLSNMPTPSECQR